MGGGFSIFGAKVHDKIAGWRAVIAGVIGLFLLGIGLWSELREKSGPKQAEVFDLTVRAHSVDGRDPLITTGTVTIDFGGDRETRQFGIDGQAEFKNVPQKFKDTVLEVLPKIAGYEEKWQQCKAKEEVIDLVLIRKAPPVTMLIGSIRPIPPSGHRTVITADGQTVGATPDSLGRFELRVKGKAGDRVRLRVYVDDKLEYDDFQVLPGPVTIQLNQEK
jgi:hypothetical protein